MGLPSPRYGHELGSIENISQTNLAQNVISEKKRGQTVGFIGGPPCPDFSIGGKNQGKDGKDGKLSKVYIDLVCTHKPDFFLFENVKGLYRTKKHREFFNKLKSKVKRAGYRIHERLINSIEYGVPQDRERIILVGFYNGELEKQFTWARPLYPNREAIDYDWHSTDHFKAGGPRKRKKGVPKELCVQH